MKARTFSPLSLVFILFATSGGASADCEFTLTSDPAIINTVDQGTAGLSLGDLLFGESVLRYRSVPIGYESFALETSHLPVPSMTGPGAYEHRLGFGQYHFSNGDSLVSAGELLYPAPNAEIKINTPQSRAITGGTGRFKFASGQVTLTRQPDGSVKHDFELDAKPSACKFNP